MVRSVCPECLHSFERTHGARCEDCTPQRDHKLQDSRRGSSRQRGYDAAWTRLSKRARKLQPFCEDCGTTDDLTCDHSIEAWERKAAGKPVRLQDVAVVCRTCNSERGAARGENANDTWRSQASSRKI